MKSKWNPECQAERNATKEVKMYKVTYNNIRHSSTVLAWRKAGVEVVNLLTPESHTYIHSYLNRKESDQVTSTPNR